MENASKALLIAAGVLIVILLIAFGMKIFNSAGDTSADAQDVGTGINSEISDANISIILSTMDYKDGQVFYKYISKNYANKTLSDIQTKELIKLVSIRNKKLTGEENSTSTIYISRWDKQSGGADIWWRNTLKKTLEFVEENKKYKIQISTRENNNYAIMIYYAN